MFIYYMNWGLRFIACVWESSYPKTFYLKKGLFFSAELSVTFVLNCVFMLPSAALIFIYVTFLSVPYCFDC